MDRVRSHTQRRVLSHGDANCKRNGQTPTRTNTVLCDELISILDWRYNSANDPMVSFSAGLKDGTNGGKNMTNRTNIFAKQIERFVSNVSGATAIEYAVMLALIIMIALGSIAGIGLTVEGSFTAMYERLVRLF